MTAIRPDVILIAFALFCRIGSCLMLMPGFSGARIPVNVRLFLAFSVTLALTPVLSGQVEKGISAGVPAALIGLFLSEIVIGALIGFLGRTYLGALETFAGVIAMAIGLTSPLAGPAQDNEVLPPIVSLVTLAATALIFLTNLHWEVLRGLVASYSVVPALGLFDSRFDLIQVIDCLAKSFLVSLRIASPFIAYALIANLAVGLASKLVPQIPIYFITVPAILAGGLLLFYATCKPFMSTQLASHSCGFSTTHSRPGSLPVDTRGAAHRPNGANAIPAGT